MHFAKVALLIMIIGVVLIIFTKPIISLLPKANTGAGDLALVLVLGGAAIAAMCCIVGASLKRQ